MNKVSVYFTGDFQPVTIFEVTGAFVDAEGVYIVTHASGTDKFPLRNVRRISES